jgi:hypothetical protein
MTGNDLISLYEFSYGAIKRNLEGISNEETLMVPQPSGNCINWVLGYVVAARRLVLRLAGASPIEPEVLDRYGRGSVALVEGEAPADLATLRGLLDDSQQLLLPALAQLSPEALASPIPEKFRRPPLTGSVADALARMNAHENYHNGQLGLLRRLVGKEGAIR